MARSRSSNYLANLAERPAFLLAQVGAHASSRFAERLALLNLAPPHAGILRVINEADGLSQQALGEKLGMFPSRLVQILDDLEERKLVERRNNPADRRSYALYLTKAGHEALQQIGRTALEHEDALCAALNESERAQLADLLTRIATQQQLSPGIHPNIRKLGGGRAR